MPREPRKLTVYPLGEGYPTTAEGKLLYSWPYTVAYAPDNSSGDFYLAEGDARHGNGSFFSAAAVLEPQWRSHLEITQTLWLLPLLERRARGEEVPPAEVLDAYREANGKAAVAEDWNLY